MENNRHLRAPERPQMGQVLPSDPEAEKALLAILLTCPSAYYSVCSNLCPDDFYNVTNRAIFDCIRALAKEGVEACIVSVATKAAAIHPEVSPGDIAIIATNRDGGSDAEYLARVLRNLRERRTLWTMMQDAAAKSLSFDQQPGDIAERLRKQLDDLQAVGSEHVFGLDSSLDELEQHVSDNRDPAKRHSGTPTGFSYFDRSGGFQCGDLIVLGAESSQGKTSLAMSICLNALLHGERIGYFSLEMSRQQLASRWVAMLSGVSSSNILYAPLCDSDANSFRSTVSALRNRTTGGDILVDDRATSDLEKILSSIRTMKIRHDVSGVVVDFLQRLRPARGMSKEQFIGEASQRLKDAGRELGVWVLALSQLSRDKDSPIPSIGRLRDSGQIAEAADVVLLLYRPEAVQPYSSARAFPEPFSNYDPKGHAMLMVGKGRNIGTGSFLCGFDAPTTRFYEKPLYQIPTIGTSGSTRSPGKPF